MRRLLLGDVGSGKTLVALAACLAVADGGGQAAFLAPTEVLAEQHHSALAPLASALGIEALLVTGSLTAADRRASHSALRDGRATLAVGTHALLADDVAFRRLDLVVVDEQQRFGVAQRRALLEKGRDVHLLSTTATPIPRTLALTLYGDLDLTLLRGRPAGRGRLRTRVVPSERRERALAFVADELAQGGRAFWVCPRIEEADDEVAAAEATYAELAPGPLGRHGATLVHGRVPPDERAQRLERFRTGAAALLVGTTLIEVGVDVPEATIMVVEGAERFGLAQLHQLRGRVGRGPRDAWCLLLPDDENELARERLAVLEREDDGFIIAEEDLRRRGMGDLAGLRQAGENAEGLADPATDLELVDWARRVVREDASVRDAFLGGGV